MNARPHSNVRLIDLADLRGCVDVAGIFALFRRLRYPVEAMVAVPLANEELHGQLRDAVAGRYLVADLTSADEEPLTVTLFALRPNLAHVSAYIRQIALEWARKFRGNHLITFASQEGDQFRTISIVNARRLGEGAVVRTKLFKLIIDRTNPTRHDLDTLNAIALTPQLQGDPDAIYQAQCKAFDVERITGEFYREYTRRFNLVKTRIKADNPGLAICADPNKLHAFTQRLFGRLMFLYFLQKKGALNNRPDFITHWYTECSQESENFYRFALEPLFFETLNTPRPENHAPRFGRVPYLNGGLFAPDADDVWGEIYLDDEIFDPNSENGLLYFLNTHNFTVSEDTPLEVEVALDPEMLGKVFENLLAVDERGQSGTFYTPRPVVAFMCREALGIYLERTVRGVTAEQIGYLLDEAETGEPTRHPATNQERLHASNFPRALRGQVEDALKFVRVLDPAVGSGAFPLGMLALLVGVRRALYRIGEAQIAPNADIVQGWKRDCIRDCLYGVDIKREAIEIARLRLWLALVVDADPQHMEPLPNLDYKLMDGNSLIETFNGEEIYATRPPAQETLPEMRIADPQLARLHDLQDHYFEPGAGADRLAMQDAIRAAEYAIVSAHLDERIEANGIKLKSLLTQIANLGGRGETRQQQRDREHLLHSINTTQTAKADILQNKTLPFFLYRLHFANVFQEKDGFDIVIANPPYVRHERVDHDQLATLKASYPDVAHGMADLYVYFFARALQLLHAGGTLAFITSNKYFRAGYGEKLRQKLADRTSVRTVIDFGDAPIFDAAAYPSILITTNEPPHADHQYRGLTADNTIDLEKIGAIVAATGQDLAQRDGVRPPASSGAASALVAKLLGMGTPLGHYAGGKMYYGIKTGLNDAFVVDQATRDQLIVADPRSAEVLKPFLRGRDVGRYTISHAGLWLIFTRQGTDIDRYPAVKAHLEHWRERLEPKPRNWDDAMPWPGRKSGPYKWYELQDTIDYYAEFEKPKIVSVRFGLQTGFAFDNSGIYCNDAVYTYSPAQSWIVAIINSKMCNLILISICPTVQNGYSQFFVNKIQQLPIIEPTITDLQRLTALVERLQVLGGVGEEAAALEAEADAIVYRTYGLTAEEIAEVERWHAERRALLGR